MVNYKSNESMKIQDDLKIEDAIKIEDTIKEVVIYHFRELSHECRVVLTWRSGLVMDYTGWKHNVYEYICAYRSTDTVIRYAGQR